MERLIRIYHQYGLLGTAGIVGLVETGLLFFLPDEWLLIYLGFRIQQGAHSLPLALLAISLNVLLGSSVLYWLARSQGHPLLLRYGRYLGLTPARLERAEQTLQRWGGWAILSGRLIPGLRLTLTSSAGILRFPYLRFMALMGIAVPLWTLMYLGVGYFVGENALHSVTVREQALELARQNMPIILTVALVCLTLYSLWRRWSVLLRAAGLGLLRLGSQRLNQIAQQTIEHIANRN